MRLLLVLTLCAATQALAVRPGDKLFIKTKDAAVMKQPSEKGAPVMKLQPGNEVIWLGASEKDAQWHEISANGKKGFVRRGDLSPHAPAAEIADSGKPIAQAFASSGAATKGPFGPPARSFSGANEQASAAELIYVEELNRAKATPAAVAAKNKELHR